MGVWILFEDLHGLNAIFDCDVHGVQLFHYPHCVVTPYGHLATACATAPPTQQAPSSKNQRR